MPRQKHKPKTRSKDTFLMLFYTALYQSMVKKLSLWKPAWPLHGFATLRSLIELP